MSNGSKETIGLINTQYITGLSEGILKRGWLLRGGVATDCGVMVWESVCPPPLELLAFFITCRYGFNLVHALMIILGDGELKINNYRRGSGIYLSRGGDIQNKTSALRVNVNTSSSMVCR